jgi:hypothetical protein
VVAAAPVLALLLPPLRRVSEIVINYALEAAGESILRSMTLAAHGAMLKAGVPMPIIPPDGVATTSAGVARQLRLNRASVCNCPSVRSDHLDVTG